MYNQKGINTSWELSISYLWLGRILFREGNHKKAHNAFCNAKSSCGILPMSHSLIIEIYAALGEYYLENRSYEDGIVHLESIISYIKGKPLINTKYKIGLAYFCIEKYDKASQIFIEMEESLLSLPSTSKEDLIDVFEMIGKIYDLKGNIEKADFYFCKAFELIKYSETVYSFTFDYFLMKNDYKKCDEILNVKNNLSGSGDNNIFEKCELLIIFSHLCLIKNEIKESEEYLDKAEKLLKSTIPSLKTKINRKLIGNLILIGQLYEIKREFSKLENTYKFIESLLDINIPVFAGLIKLIVEWFRNWYFKQNRWVEAGEYNQKLINILQILNNNEVFRLQTNLSKADIESQFKDAKMIEKKIFNSIPLN